MLPVRAAEVSDADEIGKVHVAAWRSAYRGLMPDSYLDGLDASHSAERWRRAIADGGGDGRARVDDGEPALLVVQDDSGLIVGIANIGPARDEDRPLVGELWMINVEPASWGRGYGRALLSAASEQLRISGFREAILWVLEGNDRARRFYEASGWTVDGYSRVDERFGSPIIEIRYQRLLSA